MKKNPPIGDIIKALFVILFIEIVTIRTEQVTILSLNSALSSEGNIIIETMVLKNQRTNLQQQETTHEIAIDETMKQEIEIVSLKASTPVIVYNGMTMEELANKLNRSLKSDLSGYGMTYATNSIKYGVDPYLAVAISLLETGCNWGCSSLVTYNHNVGGMVGGSSYASFNTLDEGIEAMISNLSRNYIQQGLITPETIGKKYATSSTWAEKVKNYINQIANT